MQGVINVNKPKNMTSHDVVYFIRRTLKIKRVGHTGTLDPDADGVLPILVGNATKLSDLLMSEEKEYIAGVKLGLATDTYDMSGKVTEKKDASFVKREDTENAIKCFIGEISQIPPMYSAIKIDGKKLCNLARKGIEVKRPPRQISIKEIELISFDDEKKEFIIRVLCSKGTYIRTLCYDIGKKLGTLAAVTSLTRTKTGKFSLENSFTLDEIKQRDINEILICIDEILKEYKKVNVDEKTAVKVKNGIRLRPLQLGIEEYEMGQVFRIYENNKLICISSVVETDEGIVLKMEKSFFGGDEA